VKKPFLILSFVWAAILAVLSLSSGQDLPKIDIDYFDKIGHFLVYAILTFFIYKAGIEAKLKSPLLIAVFLPCIYGVLMEILQGTFSEVRSPDIFDALANAFGAIFVATILFLRR